MNKYPVTSANGNEYLVEMNHGSLGIFFVDVCVPYRGLFGRQKWEKVNGDYTNFTPSVHDYDYVRIAKLAVEKYEGSTAKAIRVKALKAEGKRKFEEWDGDCR